MVSRVFSINTKCQIPVCRADRHLKNTQKRGNDHGTIFFGNRQQPVSGAAHCRRVGDAALRPERLHQGMGYRPVQTGRDVVLVTPTYAWRIPRVVSEWLGKTELTGAERIWFVMDCGSEIAMQQAITGSLRRKNTCIIWGLPRSSCRKTTLPCLMHPRRSRQRASWSRQSLNFRRC